MKHPHETSQKLSKTTIILLVNKRSGTLHHQIEITMKMHTMFDKYKLVLEKFMYGCFCNLFHSLGGAAGSWFGGTMTYITDGWTGASGFWGTSRGMATYKIKIHLGLHAFTSIKSAIFRHDICLLLYIYFMIIAIRFFSLTLSMTLPGFPHSTGSTHLSIIYWDMVTNRMKSD